MKKIGLSGHGGSGGTLPGQIVEAAGNPRKSWDELEPIFALDDLPERVLLVTPYQSVLPDPEMWLTDWAFLNSRSPAFVLILPAATCNPFACGRERLG